MRKKAMNQFLKDSVNKLDDINNFEFEFIGSIKEIIEDPIKWAESQSERAILESKDRYLDAKELGEEFWGEIKNID